MLASSILKSAQRTGSLQFKAAFATQAKPIGAGKPRVTQNLDLARRLRNKKTLEAPVDFREQDSILVQERLGDNFSVNWTLASHQIAAGNAQVFRNLHLRHLVQYGKGKLDENKALLTTVGNEKEPEQVFVQGQPAPKGALTLTPQAFQKLATEVRRSLYDSEAIFLEDGALGAHRTAELKVRLIGNDAKFALFAHHVIPRVPLKEPRDFEPEIVAIFAPNFKLSKPESYGLKGTSFTAYDASSGTLIVAGFQNTAYFRNALFYAAAATSLSQAENAILPVAAHSYITGNGLSLVFGGNFLQQRESLKVFGSDHHFLTSAGVVRTWKGISRPVEGKATTQRGDLVEEFENKKLVVTSSLPTGNISGQPTSIVFVANKGNLPEIAKLSQEQAVQFFLSGYNGATFDASNGQLLASLSDASKVASQFKKYLEETKANTFVVNAKSAEQFEKLLTSQGKGASALNDSQLGEVTAFIKKTYPALK